MKLLITGARGQLGLALERRLRAEHVLVTVGHRELDIADADACDQLLERERPDVLLNCAAHTAVDRAETERDLAWAINAEGAGHLARACRRVGALPVHFSTDYVFDGKATRPYRETDATHPASVYGASKLAGEQAVAHECTEHLTFRLSWVYGNDGANFYRTMLRLAGERSRLRVVSDQSGVPNYTADIANAIASVLQRPRPELVARSGLYHLSAVGRTNWCEFARAIFRGAGVADRVAVEAISTSEYPTAAVRPAFSVLDSSRFAATFGVAMPDWNDALQRCLAARVMSA